jgi:hypothetical protein
MNFPSIDSDAYKVKPITPEQASLGKQTSIPSEVIESFNELIIENYRNYSCSSNFTQKDVVSKICNKMNLENDRKIYDSHWLDVESLFEKYGWKVKYDKPAYCENYDANFTFTKKKE